METQQPTSPQQADPVPPTEPPHHKPLKIILIAIGILLASIVLVFAYQAMQRNRSWRFTEPPEMMESINTLPLSPTPDETAEWKTYRDEFLTFQYPSDWSIGETIVFGSWSTVDFDYNYGKPLYIHYYGNYNQTTGQPYKTLKEYVLEKSTQTQEAQDRTISNHYAVYRKSEGEEGHVLPFEEVFLFTPDKRQIINLYFQPDYYDKAIQSNTFDQILSTFRFLEEKTSAENWKTYSNSKYKYSFEYPETWGKGATCEGDAAIDLQRFSPELLKFPYSHCGTANISSDVMFYVEPTFTSRPGYEVEDQKKLNIDGVSANYFIYRIVDRKNTAGPDSFAQVVIPLEKYNMQLIGITNDLAMNNVQSVFDQILSTFRFVE